MTIGRWLASYGWVALVVIATGFVNVMTSAQHVISFIVIRVAMIAYGLLHITFMVLLREVTYGAFSGSYSFAWNDQFAGEFRKDLVSALMIAVVFWLIDHRSDTAKHARVDQQTAPEMPRSEIGCETDRTASGSIRHKLSWPPQAETTSNLRCLGEDIRGTLLKSNAFRTRDDADMNRERRRTNRCCVASGPRRPWSLNAAHAAAILIVAPPRPAGGKHSRQRRILQWVNVP